MKHLTKRVLSVVLSLIMVMSMFTMVSFTAGAEEDTETEPATVELPIDKTILKANAKTNSYAHAWNDGPASYAFDNKDNSAWASVYKDASAVTEEEEYHNYEHTGQLGNGAGKYYGQTKANVGGNTNWLDTLIGEDTPVWIQTGFNEQKIISKIVYKHNNDSQISNDSYKVYVSTSDNEPSSEKTDYAKDDTENWTEVTSTKTVEGNLTTITFDPTEAKYVRIEITASTNNRGFISIYEMDIYEHLSGEEAENQILKYTEIERETLKEHAQANSQQNATSGDGNAACAFDDNTNSWWHSKYNDSGSGIDGNVSDSNPIWIQTGWGNLKAISKISYQPRLDNNNNAIGRFKVYYTTAAQIPDVTISAEDANSPWKLQGTYEFGNLGDAVRNIEFDESFVATYIRIVVLSKTGGGDNHVTASYIGVFEDKTVELETVEKTNVTVTADSGITAAYEVATVDGENNTVADAVVTYKAEVSEGTEFAGWYNENDECVSREATYYCSMQNAVNLTARTYKNDLTVKFAFGDEEVSEIPNVKHIFDSKLTADEALDVVFEDGESLQEALEAYGGLKYNFEINMDEELSIEDNTCTLKINKTNAKYKVVANVNGDQKTDEEEYNQNFKDITADNVNSEGQSFVGWCLTDNEDVIIATGTSYNYVANENLNITAKYEQDPTASEAIRVYIPEPVQSIQKVGDKNYNAVEVVVSTTNVADVNGETVTVKENISSFGVVIVRDGTETEDIKTAITSNSGAIIKKAYTSDGTDNIALTNKGRYLHTLYFGAIPEGYKIYAFVETNDTENNITLSSGRDLQARTAISAAVTE